MALLEVRGLVRRFLGVTAVDHVDLVVERGELVSLIGPNGSGRTTLFNCVTGYLAAESGRVLFDGRELTNAAPHRVARLGVARTFQHVSVFPRLSVHESVMIGQQARLTPRVWPALARTAAQRREMALVGQRADDVLALVMMSAVRDVEARALSYGEQRHLAIAIALASRPELLLLDEPAAGLNTGETQALADTILRIRDRGITVLLIEHDMSLVMQIAQHIVVLDFGKKIAEGSPEEIKQHPDVIAAYLGTEAAHA